MIIFKLAVMQGFVLTDHESADDSAGCDAGVCAYNHDSAVPDPGIFSTDHGCAGCNAGGFSYLSRTRFQFMSLHQL